MDGKANERVEELGVICEYTSIFSLSLSGTGLAVHACRWTFLRKFCLVIERR